MVERGRGCRSWRGKTGRKSGKAAVDAEEEKRRRWKSNATFGGMKRRRSVAVDVGIERGGWGGQGRRTRRVGGEGAGVRNDTEGNKNQTSTRHRTLTV